MLHPNAHTSFTGRVAENATINEKGYGAFTLTVDLGEKFPWGRFHNFEILFSLRYDKAAQYLIKGASVTCICTPYLDSWDDKFTGEKRYKHKYALESIHFNESSLSRKEKNTAPLQTRETDEDYPF